MALGCSGKAPRRQGKMATRGEAMRKLILAVVLALGAGLAGMAPALGEELRIGISQYRSEEHTSELQSLMRNSYDVFCLKQNNKTDHIVQSSNYETTQQYN